MALRRHLFSKPAQHPAAAAPISTSKTFRVFGSIAPRSNGGHPPTITPSDQPDGKVLIDKISSYGDFISFCCETGYIGLTFVRDRATYRCVQNFLLRQTMFPFIFRFHCFRLGGGECVLVGLGGKPARFLPLAVRFRFGVSYLL